LCMFPRSKCNVCRSLGRNPCPGLSPDTFVAVISISLFDQFPGFSRKLLNGQYFWKFHIFFDFGRWGMNVNGMEAQYSYSSSKYSLSSLEQWYTCDRGSNILKWPALIGMK
jgi:hypothetical protein